MDLDDRTDSYVYPAFSHNHAVIYDKLAFDVGNYINQSIIGIISSKEVVE